MFIECTACYRADGPPELRTLGETEFVNGIAAMSASGGYGPTRVAAGIVGLVDLTIGGRAEEILRAHMAAAGPRFKGIRNAAAWEDKAPEIHNAHTNPGPHLYRDHAKFREGFAALGRLGLRFDAWLYHPQIPDLTALARAFPAQPIVLDHVGGPLGLGWYAGKRDEIFAGWKRDIVELAGCPNVHMKLGGLGMRINGFQFHHRERAAVLQGPGRCLAALHRDLHRGVRAEALHVREQLPRRQDLGLLCRLLERLQAAGRGRLGRRQSRALPRYGEEVLSACPDGHCTLLEGDMKIERVRSQIVRLPADEPLADGKATPGATREIVVVKVVTKDGIDGLGVTFFGAALTGALKAAVDGLGALIVGDDPHRDRAHRRQAAQRRRRHRRAQRHLHAGASAIDTALWDIRGKALGLPVAKLLGGFRDRVPAYASGALMRTLSLDEVVTAAGRLVERGWTAMKTQLALPGGTVAEIEVERMRRMREAIGPDIRLMCDINQRWTVPEAISIGERIEPYRLHWLEDVTTRDDYAGLAHVAAKLVDADRGRRVRLRHRALPAHAGGALGRHRHDRSRARRRHHAVDEGGRHGRGVQPAGRVAPDPGGARASDRGHPQRAHRRVHALDAPLVRQPAPAGEGRDGRAVCAGLRPRLHARHRRGLRSRLRTRPSSTPAQGDRLVVPAVAVHASLHAPSISIDDIG